MQVNQMPIRSNYVKIAEKKMLVQSGLDFGGIWVSEKNLDRPNWDRKWWLRKN